mmetsp:Transcript_90392/g.195619  ORF Transcript_90392/g.195619 Transcript_90392/m.195619 type:complete len:332 (-) Transcript_90392:1063-2058(-)
MPPLPAPLSLCLLTFENHEYFDDHFDGSLFKFDSVEVRTLIHDNGVSLDCVDLELVVDQRDFAAVLTQEQVAVQTLAQDIRLLLLVENDLATHAGHPVLAFDGRDYGSALLVVLLLLQGQILQSPGFLHYLGGGYVFLDLHDFATWRHYLQLSAILDFHSQILVFVDFYQAVWTIVPQGLDFVQFERDYVVFDSVAGPIQFQGNLQSVCVSLFVCIKLVFILDWISIFDFIFIIICCITIYVVKTECFGVKRNVFKYSISTVGVEQQIHLGRFSCFVVVFRMRFNLIVFNLILIEVLVFSFLVGVFELLVERIIININNIIILPRILLLMV